MKGCRDCYHHRVTGGHSSCHHPLTAAAHQLPIAATIEEMGHALPLPVFGLEVVGDPHAVAMGWWAWPYNFDANWLINCSGFESVKQRFETVEEAHHG